jgi:hypothetical protein
LLMKMDPGQRSLLRSWFAGFEMHARTDQSLYCASAQINSLQIFEIQCYSGEALLRLGSDECSFTT